MAQTQTYKQALDEAETALFAQPPRSPTPLGALARVCFIASVPIKFGDPDPFDPKELFDDAVERGLSATGLLADLARQDPVNMGAYANVGRLAERRRAEQQFTVRDADCVRSDDFEDVS